MSETRHNAGEADDQPVIRLTGVGVRFGSNRVLQGVDLALYPGTITALLGTNGAGKSTLIGAISGSVSHDAGQIEIAGHSGPIGSPAAARHAGIETVHQRIADGIVPGLSVADNVLLTDLATHGHRIVRRRESLRAARAALSRLGLHWSDEVLTTDAARLGASDAQLLILARALRSTPRLLILDEPTSALTQAEADRLFEVVRSLRDAGLAIVFVSHRFGEVERLADRIVVLRDGSVTLDASRPFDWRAAIEAMLGVPTELQQHVTDPLPAGDVELDAEGVTLLPGAAALSLQIHSGHVTGVLGLLGAGKTELAEALGGARPAPGATLRLGDADFAPTSPAAAIERGVVLVPEDRQRDGIQQGWSISRTVGLPVLSEISTRLGFIRTRAETAVGAEVVRDYGVVAPSAATAVDDLSGGNQQKVMVGRWLRTDPRVALLDEPFRGVDIGARRAIGAAARAQAAGGCAVVVFSSDIDEILDVADRIIVLVQGRIVLDVPAGTVPRERLVAALLDDPHHQKESA
ncbi:sugar ABC transporter ATP-binding protein [Microbacterium sp.]|uniref:sugar ABC transporter ATP-binding protein n=1 Tax=Microbacterium sp. TaxID=51671 RepID=UPI002639D2A6|nr:sugar ABC transporter ATP-binding protein [Microbacterium sp.]